jgi:ribosomal protein S18 acetylase RimI-like enzyme
MKCHYDERTAAYRCARTGEYVCLEHARLDIVSVSTRVRPPSLPVRAAEPADHAAIKEMALMYWGETEVDCFDRTYDITTLPAWLAHSDGELAGMLSFAVEADALTIVMLNVHPQYQGRRTARCLLAMAEHEARRRGLSRLLVATSNDDLPAIYLYQRWGFVISGIKVGAILAHHGHEEPGFASIPVRDEVRLEKRLAIHE